MASQIPNVRVRLQQAAVELFQEHGYDRTTAADIAARVGVTERTFFRHFPDKREVLFDGQAALVDALASSVADAPAGLGPLDRLFRAFRSVTRLLEDNRPFSKPRQEVISKTPALQERELAKLEALADALALALKGRDVSDLQATLAAHASLAAFAHATTSWLENEEPGLAERLNLAEQECLLHADVAARCGPGLRPGSQAPAKPLPTILRGSTTRLNSSSLMSPDCRVGK